MDYSIPAVQAGHAVAEFLLHNKTQNWDNDILIYLRVDNGKDLKKWCSKLDRKNVKWTGFNEPDYNDELTAIAVESTDKKIFSGLKLL